MPVVSVRLRLGCVLLHGGEPVKTINEADVPSRNQMGVFVRCDLDGAVSHLIANVWPGSARLDQQTSEGMPQVVKPDAPQASTPESGKEVSLADRPRADGVRIFARGRLGHRRSNFWPVGTPPAYEYRAAKEARVATHETYRRDGCGCPSAY